MASHQGVLVRVLKRRGYGFIRTEDGQEYFAHSSGFTGGWRTAAVGDAVSFDVSALGDRKVATNAVVSSSSSAERAKRRVSVRASKSYNGATCDLNESQRTSALTDISKWKLEARLDDIQRYFFAVPELNQVQEGTASYVIGRKGTGKTALVQYISETSNSDFLVKKLTFKNFPFNELYKQANDVYTRPTQYLTIWKLIIYSAVCRLIAESKIGDPLIKRSIDKAFPPIESDNLGTIVGRWIAGDFGLTVLGTGFNASKWFKEKKPITLQQKVENLEAFVKKNITRQSYLILFDELDEDYKEMFENYIKSDYLDLLTSLFKAVQDIRATFAGTNIKLFPVLFLRDDIYDLIQDADKNKWRDLTVDLEWTDEGIRALLAHRLSKVIGSSDENFDKLWYSIVTHNTLVYSHGSKRIAPFDYIKMSAQGRPRDYVNYFQECASIELKRSKVEISTDTIKDADKAYSNYLKKELVDEIHGIIPDIQNVLAIFSETRKWILNIEEFRKAYNERVEAGRMAIKDVDFVLRTLFYFSVIGNVLRVGVHVFRHERPDAQLNFKEKIVVHRGLMKALQII